MTDVLNYAQLAAIMPAAAQRAPRFMPGLNLTLLAFDINTRLRMAAFLAQIAVESGELSYTREIWGPTEQQAKYEPPSSVASALGNTERGDGYSFRGRGLIQITGRDNYTRCGRELGVDLVSCPTVLEQPLLACLSAGWYWSSRRINTQADAGNFEAVTRLVNGGLTALGERRKFYDQAMKVLLL